MSDSNNSVLLDFSPSKHPHLVDHVVSGDQPTLSAATLLCSVIENQHSNSQLHQITFLSTIELEEGKQLKLAENEDLLNVISNDGAIVLSAKTTKSIANLDVIEEELMSSLNFPLHSTDIDLILAEKFYPFMNNVGYRHKGDFQSVHWLELRIQDDKAYGTVVFNSSPNLDCQLDGLWQAIVYALLSTKSSSQRELLVPFCIRSLKSKSLGILSTEWICSGRFVVNLRENYGNFMLFDGISNEVLMVGEEVIFLPKSTDEVESNETEDEQKLQQENGNKVDRMREDNATKMAADLQKIGIRSMSCRLPGNVKSPEDFWELLESARSTDQKIPAERISNRNELIRGQRYGNPIEGGNFLDEDVSLFDAALFRLSQNEANAADPQQRFALMCAYECLEKAGLIVDNGENLRNLGIFVGMMGTEYYCEDANTSNALMMLGASASIACGRISHFLDSRGISAVVDTACSSSLVALDMARSHLLDGRIDKALVIGVNLILSEKAMGQRANGKLLSVDGRCKSFDAQADGYGRADGCVAMLIERAQHDRQYEAFIESTNTNHDGKSAALTVPNGTSHVELIQRCMESVKDLEEKSIAFWEIHGTGTALGDPIEVNSLQKALSKYAENLNESVFLSTAKANIGHTEAASGLVGVLKSVLQLKHAQICPLPNFRSLNPQIQLSPNFKIPTRAVNLLSANKLCCGISSFGVGGTNACAILSKAEEINFKQQPTPTFKVLPISAKTKHSLQMMIEQINSLSFNQHMAPAFALHRRHYNHRTAFISQQNCFEQVTFEKEPIRLQILKVDQQPNKFWKTIPHCTDIYNKLSNNAHIDLVILLKFLKEVGVKRNIFYTDHSKAEAMLNFVYSNNFDDLLIKQHDNNSFGLFFNSSNNSVLINSVQALEELIACLYISNSCEINWNFIYPASDENFLLEVVKTLPTYSFDNNICWKTSRQLPVFDHSILGNVIEKDDTRFKLENYLSKHRLPEFFEKKYITIGFVIEGLASISQYLRPSATVSVNKWQFNNQVFVRQMWVFTEVEVSANNTWRFHFLTDGQTICKASGNFIQDDSNLNATKKEVKHLKPVTIDVKKPSRFISSIESNNFHSTKVALSLNKIIKDVTFKPTRLNCNLRSISSYSINNSEIKFYNDEHQFCAEFCAELFLNNKSTNKKMKEKARQSATHSTEEDQNPDELAIKIAKLLQLSVINGLELSRNCYDVGFFDLGLDSLAMIGFANQMIEAQLPRLTTEELMTHSTVNKLTAYIRQKTGLLTKTNNPYDSGYSSVLNDDSSNERKNSDQQIDKTQLMYRILRNNEKVEERFKFRVAFNVKRNDISIFFRHDNKRSELTFNALSTRIAELKPNQIELSFKMPNELVDLNQTSVSKLFLKLGNALINSNQIIEIHVKATENLITEMAMSFLKSLCAEHPAMLTFCFHEKLQLVGKEKEERRIISNVWVVTGGTKGLGWQLSKHLLQKYSTNVILIARRQPIDNVAREIKQFGERVQVLLADVSNKNQILAVFNQIAQQYNSISIIHSAGIADDVLIQSQNIHRFGRVFEAKCKGLLNLKRAAQQYNIKIDNWILNSSVSSTLGNVGQSNYAAANAFLDAFALLHPNACSINWANWTETGFASSSSITDVLRKKGFYGLKTDEALECFDWILSHRSVDQIFVARVDWHQMFKFRPELKNVVIQVDTAKLLQKELESRLSALKKVSNQTSQIDDIQQTEQILETEVKKLLKMNETEAIERTIGFMELGLDSFGMFNLSNQINRIYEQNLVNIIHLFEHSTIETLSIFIQQKLQNSSPIIQHSNDQNASSSAINSNTQQKETQSNKIENSKKDSEKQEKTSKPTNKAKATVSFSKPLKRPNLLFLFGGNGSLYSGVCADLIAKVPFVEQQVNICSQHFQEHLKTTSVADIIKQSKTDEIKCLPVEHAVIFTIGYTLAKFWLHVNLEPTHLIGHSLGEIIAICIAGRLELVDAVHLVYLRAKALEKCKGAMMAVDSNFLPNVDRFDLSVAAINGPKQIVLSGSNKQIEKAKLEATKHGLPTKVISEKYAFHSKLVKDKYLKQLNNFEWSKVQNQPNSETKVISNLNAETLTDFNCQYAKQQATSTVQFWKSIENLLTEGEMTVLEVGAGRILSSLTQKIINEHSLRYLILNTIQKDQENELDTLKCKHFLWSAQKLELKGFSINQRKFSDAIGEDFVEQISNAFSSSFRLAKTGSLNAKHHRVTYQRRIMNPNSRRQSSAANLDGNPVKQQVENNKQLILHRRQVEIDELDLSIISDHRLFDETIAPAAFHFKCFSEHLRLQQIHLKDVRLTSKILVDDLDSLVTVFDQGRLQLKQSGGDEKLFSSCLVEVAPEASETTVKLSQDQTEKMTSATVPAELDLCGQEKRKRKPTVNQSEDNAPDFPDQDPGIWISPRKFYNGMAASGFCYDKHLQLLLDIRLIGLNRIRTRSQKPSASWVLFDLALQTLSAGLFDVRSTKCYIPVAVEEVYSNFPSDWTADGQGWWTFHGEVSKREGDLVEGSVWIFSRGILIGHLKGIRAIRSIPTQADIVARRDRRNVISTDDEFEGGDGTDKKKRRKSRSQHGHKKPKDVAPDQSQTKHASFSSTASEFFEASRRKSSSTASKIALAVNNFKRTRLQRDFPLRFKKDSDELLFVVRGSFGQFATDEVHPFFESISQQSHSHNVFMLEQRKTGLDAGFFGMTPKEAKFIDPNQRFLLEATQRCLESANLKQLPSNCGVFIGSSSSDFAQKAFAELEDPNAYLMAGTNSSTLSGRLAHFFQANGPCLTIDTACSSFHTALSVACNFLSQQTCEWALVGASNLILNEKTTKVMQGSGMLSPSHRCASFDAEADGFVRSEGYGVILVEAVPKTKSHMLRNDSILIKGWSVGHTGGKSAGFLVPDPSAEASTMLEACQQSQIDLIECHGTGTSLGDPIEIEGIKRFLKATGQTNKEIYLNSMKTYFGHCEASAGLVSMLAMMEVMRYGKIPPLRHFNKLNPNIQLFENMLLPVETTEGNFQRVLINSFGFTGTNSSILLEKYGSLAGKKFNFNRAPVNKVPKAVFNREYLWPFNEEIKQAECKLLQYHLEFEETGFTLNQLVERAKTICYCGRKFTKQSISIGRLKPAVIKDLSEENLILIWSVNKKKLAEQSAKICRFLAHLKSNSFIDVVAPILFAPTVFALIKTCIAERNFRNMRFYAVDDQQLVLPKIKVDFFETSDKAVKFNKCVVTGGLGGIGQKLLEKLPAQQKLVIGRTCRELINKKLPKNCKYWNCDVAERTQLERLFRSEPKIELVVHCAGVVQNALLKNQDAKHFEQIFSAKVVGTKNLLKLCRQYGVRKLVVISSIAAIYGSVGQANYAAANAEMTRLIEKEESVECLSIALGPILDAGMLSTDKKQPIRQQIESSGWEMVCVDEVIKNILSILNEKGQFIIASGSKLNKDSPQKTESVKMEKTDVYFDKNSIQAEVEKMLTEISGLKEVPANRGLMSLGVDSLMIENLRFSLCQKFGIEISPAEIYEHTTLNDLSDFLKKKLELKAPTIFPADESSSTSDSLSLVQEEQQIAIVGFSGRMPNSENVDEFFQQLMDGKELFTSVKRRPNFVNISSCLKNVNQLDFNFFDLSKEDAALLDPQIKVLLTVAHTALEDSGYTQQRRRELKIACFTAAEPSEFETNTTFAKGSLHGMYAKNQKDFVAAWISHLLGLKGSTNAVYSACSSSLVAIANAVQLLQTNKDVDLCLVGGINLVNEVGHQIDSGSPMSKNTSSLPFSKQANGIIRGSACGVVLLKRLKDALNDNDCVLATITEIAVNNDANRLKSNFLAPSIKGQQEVMKECLTSIEDSTLDYVECHATGTIIGDAIEIKALQNALQSTNIQSTPFIGSVKANLGHAFAASGMASLAKCLNILKTRQIPPQIGIKQEDIIGEVDQSKVKINTTPVKLPNNTLRLMINNFGIGGTNACMIIEEFEQEKRLQKVELKKQIENFYLIALSARSKLSCIANCHKLADYLLKNPTTELNVLSNTLRNYRDQHEYRFAALVKNVKDAVDQLKSVEECDVKKAESNRPFALYFGHQGLQYAQILQVEKEACSNFSKIYNNYVPEFDDNQLDNPSTASSFLFGLFGSVVEFLKQSGMHQPNVVFGHSLGEYGAMLTSGALEFKEGLDFVAKRGELLEKTQKASMFAVQTDQDDIHDQLYLSAILSPTLRSFVCSQEVAKRVKEDLDKLDLQWKELRSDFGFHSQFMDPILVEFFNLSTKLQLNKMPLKFPIISNADGQLIENVDRLTPDYLTQHLRQPVRLDLTLNALSKHFPTVDTIIEIGPSGILSTLLNQQQWNCVQTIQSFSQNKHQPSPFLFKAVAKLWELGFSMNLRELFGSTNDIIRGLPAYTFDEYNFKWPTKKKEKSNKFELYNMIWKYCKQLKKSTQSCKKVWLFTDSPSEFLTDSNGLFDKVFDVQSCRPDFDELPEVLLHICLKPNRENTFYFLYSLKNVEFTQQTTLISCGLFDNPMNALSIGPLEELNRSNLKTIRVLFDDVPTMKNTIKNSLNQLLDLKHSTIPRFRCINNILLQLDYTNEVGKQASLKEKEVYLLIGGSGSLGSALVDYLNELNSKNEVIVLSRNPKKSTATSHCYAADITNQEELAENLTEMKKKCDRIDCTFFMAGLKPSSQNEKEQIDSVIGCKVDGLLNLIKSATNLNISLGSLVLCSSLSAVNGLSNIEDYCSANCFLDQQALLSLEVAKNVVKNVVSIQLPPLQNSQMLSGNKDTFLHENSIDLEEAAKCLTEACELNGIYALANANPLQIRQFIRGQTISGSFGADKTCNQLYTKTSESKSERLIKLWKSLLPGLSTAIESTDEFFALGGNSLSALQLTWKIQEEFQTHVSMDKLMENPKFYQLLNLIENSTKMTKIQRRTHNNNSGRLGLEQEQMWILGRISKPSTYNVVFKLNFDGSFDESRAFNALKLLMERQKVLRSRFFEKDGEPFQEIVPTEQALQCAFIDRKDQPINEVIKQELSHEFDLSRSAFRFVVTKSDDNFCVLINQQHIITDGFSITIFAEEFSHFYLNQNTPNEALPALEIDYIDYAEYSREHFDEQKCQEYASFLKQLPPQGTIIWPSSDKSTSNGQLEIHFDAETVDEIDLLCKEFACTRFLLVFSAFVRCVDRWRWRSKNDKEPIVVGCPTSGRNIAEVSKLIGYFLNNMVICVDATQSLQKLSLSELLDVVGNGMNQAHKYANIPFHKAVARLNHSRNTTDHQPVFQLFFNYRHQLDFPVINLGPNLHCNVEQLTNNNAFQLSCTVDELDVKRMKITFDYDQKTLNEKDVNCFAEELQKSIQLLRNINQLDSNFIHRQLSILLRPDSVAVQKPNKTQITYEKLKSRIEENAQHLMNKFYKLNQTPKADVIVPILLEMNSAIEWILAVLYCGLAYCPLDPSQPLARTQMMVKKLGSSFIVSDQEVEGFDVLNTQKLNEDLKECVVLNNHNMFEAQIQPDHLAYAIFTSGSTGEPKTVCIEHKQLSAFVDRSRKQFLIDEHARTAHSVNIVFDVSIFNIFTTLTSGGCLIQKEEIIDFVDPNNNLQLTHLILSSAIFNALRREQLLSLGKITNWVIVGGETPLDEALKTVAVDIKVSQFYGPTETAVWCTVNHYERYACQPFFLTTLDDDVPLPLDCSSRAVGELWICGDQVGRGYLHQTNGGFVENYMGVVEKAYRTGDLVRLVDQHLEFLGRRDHQFKINGMRVDPQEIVSTIQKYCDIQQVHVSLINNQLIAFIASVVTIKNEEALKTVLAKRLPRYMVPTNIIQLDGDFPLNRNGKIDQQKLEECYALKMSSATRLPPNEALTENGKKLAAIWMQTINDLNLPSINLKANFFELGGHSLSVLKLQTRIKEELAVELTFDQLYRVSNFADQLALIEDQFDYKNEVVQVIRECQNANASVYCIHAIGGTIYPYFSMSTLWPSTCNVYAISYNIDYPANTLNQLAEFYYKQACIILKHAKNIKRPFLLLGHSLGGIISWLIAALCLKNNQPVPIVCAFDSWVVDNNKLDEAEVLNYLKSRFETLEGAEKLIDAALKLCQMLKRYQMEYCSVALNLFKAERLGETALKHAIRKDLTEEMVNAKMDNGWMEYVEELSVYPCDCDHDSITEPKVLSQYVWLFEQLINQTISK